jgi:hypothetical protein
MSARIGLATALATLALAAPAFAGPPEPPDPDDPPPPPPPCDLDRTGGIQGPCLEASFPFEAEDPNNPVAGLTRCSVKLEAATPTYDFAVPIEQYRSNISCDKPIHKIEMQAALYRGSPDALGSRVGEGPLSACYGCATVAESRGADYRGGIGTYTQRTYLRLMAPDAEGDPWVLVSGTNPDNPAACAANQKVVVCYVDQEIVAPPLPGRLAGP